MEQNEMRVEYEVVGKRAGEPNKWVKLDWDVKWTLQDAKNRMEQIRREEDAAKRRGYRVFGSGLASATSPYYSEFEIIELAIKKRYVSKWEFVEE